MRRLGQFERVGKIGERACLRRFLHFLMRQERFEILLGVLLHQAHVFGARAALRPQRFARAGPSSLESHASMVARSSGSAATSSSFGTALAMAAGAPVVHAPFFSGTGDWLSRAMRAGEMTSPPGALAVRAV